MDVQKFERAERALAEIRERLREAETEEQFQAIGVLAREAMISLAQAVYVRATHPPLDGTEPSETDAKRMLEAYFAVELADNDAARKHARATVDFANTLQHKRTATGIEAALCAEATSSVLNIVAIAARWRAPAQEPKVKYVDIAYPNDAGIQRRLEDAGYFIGWVKERDLARRVDIEGYEIVVEPDSRGTPCSYRVQDRLGDLILLKRRNGPPRN